MCARTTESFETQDDEDDDDVIRNRHYHQFAMSTVCDETESVYKCTITYVTSQ